MPKEEDPLNENDPRGWWYVAYAAALLLFAIWLGWGLAKSSF
jgi:hypothetical protein